MFVSKVKSSLPRCQSDSLLVQPSTSRSASVDPAAAWRRETLHFQTSHNLRVQISRTCSTEDGSVLRATESATVLPEGMPSVGSMLHESQQCRPCAWPPDCMLKISNPNDKTNDMSRKQNWRGMKLDTVRSARSTSCFGSSGFGSQWAVRTAPSADTVTCALQAVSRTVGNCIPREPEMSQMEML